MEKKSLYQEMVEFLDFLPTKHPVPSHLNHVKAWYDNLIYFSKLCSTNIVEQVTTMGRRLYGCFNTNELPVELYMKIVNQIAMFESTWNITAWNQKALDEHSQEKIKKELEILLNCTAEKIHFERELVQLGDAAEDIAGTAVHQLRIPQVPLTKKELAEQRKRIG